jgi:hypothetical protein
MYLPDDLWWYIKNEFLRLNKKKSYFNNYKLMFYYLKFKKLLI